MQFERIIGVSVALLLVFCAVSASAQTGFTASPTPPGGTIALGSSNVGSPLTGPAQTLTANVSGVGSTLRFSAITTTGDFGLAAGGTACNTTNLYANGNTCTITPTFTPTTTGTRNGSITVTCAAVAAIGLLVVACDSVANTLYVLNGIGIAGQAGTTAAVPTLGQWALTLMACAVLALGALRLRR